jgi:hypothetical protein
MNLDVVLYIARFVLLIELLRSFVVMIKRYSEYEINKLERLIKELDEELDKRNKK